MRSAFKLAGSVDRENIKLIIHKHPPITGGKITAEESFRAVLKPYVEEICQNVESFSN